VISDCSVAALGESKMPVLPATPDAGESSLSSEGEAWRCRFVGCCADAGEGGIAPAIAYPREEGGRQAVVVGAHVSVLQETAGPLPLP